MHPRYQGLLFISRFLPFALTKGQRSKRQPTHSLRRSAYPHQPYVDTLYVLPPRRRRRRRRPKLVLTGTSTPLYVENHLSPFHFPSLPFHFPFLSNVSHSACLSYYSKLTPLIANYHVLCHVMGCLVTKFSLISSHC